MQSRLPQAAPGEVSVIAVWNRQDDGIYMVVGFSGPLVSGAHGLRGRCVGFWSAEWLGGPTGLTNRDSLRVGDLASLPSLTAGDCEMPVKESCCVRGADT